MFNRIKVRGVRRPVNKGHIGFFDPGRGNLGSMDSSIILLAKN
jgi:hypothetical protein